MKPRLWTQLGILIAAVSVVTFVASFPIRASFADRAKLTQRIRVTEGDELFAEQGKPAGTPVGTPQQIILDDPTAYLPGSGEGGARLLDERYLESHMLNPLQLQTVDFYVRYGRYAAAGGAALGALIIWLARRKLNRA